MRALYTRDKSVFERFPPEAGRIPRLRAITLLKRRRSFVEHLAARDASLGAPPASSGGALAPGRPDEREERRSALPSDPAKENERR